MSRTVSVVTAVHRPSMRFLPEAYASLVDQAMPPGWTWQWLIQEDGSTGGARLRVPADDDRVSCGTGRPLGPAIARTLALSRATGELIKVLDSDDVLAPGALARDIQAFTDPTIGWTTSGVLDVLPDGSTIACDTDPPAGRLPRGAVLAHWKAYDFRVPVHPATLCIRRPLAVMLGGWMSLPAGEDTGLLLAAAAISDGYFVAEPGLYYRKWPGQATAAPGHSDSVESRARNVVIAERADALAAAFPSGWLGSDRLAQLVG